MSGKEALRCAGISRFVDTYLDGEFAETDRAEFEGHLGDCEMCRGKVRVQAEWKQAIRAAAPNEQAPAALRNRVARSIARESKPMLSWRAWAVRAMPAAAAVGLVATFMISKVQWSPVAADVVAKHQKMMPIEVSGSGGSDSVKQVVRRQGRLSGAAAAAVQAGGLLAARRAAGVDRRQAGGLPRVRHQRRQGERVHLRRQRPAHRDAAQDRHRQSRGLLRPGAWLQRGARSATVASATRSPRTSTRSRWSSSCRPPSRLDLAFITL